MKTIIQTIGPLYGDDVNGTVFGQPNGSVYTPPANVLILLEDKTANSYVYNSSLTGTIHTCNSNKIDNIRMRYQVMAQIGTWKYRTELATDSNFANVVVSRVYLPGNTSEVSVGAFGYNSEYTIVNGTTYYARVVLLTSTGDEMAVSDTFTLTGVV